MLEKNKNAIRAFKSAWFEKAARKAGISDDELCTAIREAMKGQADDLGGGVLKKRLNDNMHRSVILAKSEQYWVYAYLFAKKDRENIDSAELASFRKLAKAYAVLQADQVAQMLNNQLLLEICHEKTA
ncbi:MAG: type II toxin-antitoxin system RelE/ParE family toxin [Sulfuricella sp.]|jgi:hypothetical protein